MTARVLVMDTNVLLGGPLPFLRRLVEEGYTLRASIIGLEERLARAARGGIGPLRTRLRNVAPYIDPREPITPQGGPLYTRLGIHDADPHKRLVNDSYSAELPRMWANLVAAGDLPNSQALAMSMDESIDRIADVVQKEIASFAGFSKEGVTYEQVRAEAAKLFAQHPIVRRFGAFRLDAYIARIATMIFNAPQQPARNDVEDLGLLEHLAEDVILTTNDYKLIAAVDATKSFQAPFIRSLWEVLDGRVPDGPPWGPPAMNAWNAHMPRTKESLKQVEIDVSAKLCVREDGDTEGPV